MEDGWGFTAFAASAMMRLSPFGAGDRAAAAGASGDRERA